MSSRLCPGLPAVRVAIAKAEPATTGKGAPLVPEMAEAVTLRLVKSTAFPSGVLELVYVLADR